MSYWAEVHHWRQIEYVLDKSLGMILLGGSKIVTRFDIVILLKRGLNVEVKCPDEFQG